MQKSIGRVLRKNLVSKKVTVLVSEKIGIKKSIGFCIEKNWYQKKVSDSVSFRFWVSSHTAEYTTYLATPHREQVFRDLSLLVSSNLASFWNMSSEFLQHPQHLFANSSFN